LAIEARYAEGKLNQLPELVAQLVQSKVDVIVVGGSTATRAAQRVTKIGNGFVASLAQPAATSPDCPLLRRR
jgi:ABC-type uncharacterized transport system substrate-binding protein